MRKKLKNFDYGLAITQPPDMIPQNALYRARGIDKLLRSSIRSRPGSSLLYSLNAHSLVKFDSIWFSGVSTSFYAAAEAIKTSLSGSRLSLTPSAPTAGKRDCLFVSGGSELFKIDTTLSIVNDTYSWTLSSSGTNEYYLTDSNDSDPAITEPTALIINSSIAPNGTLGSLSAGEWDYGDNDSLGFNTIYVRLSDNSDPDTKSDDYVECLYVQNWGISPPNETATAADGGSGGSLDDGAVYKYRFTFLNSRTGTRSNPTTEPDGTDFDSYTKLLLHCDGADGHTNFTDSSSYAHTITANGNAQGDTAQKKFGTASLLCDGTGDYLSTPDHWNWFFGSKTFTIDFQIRFNTVAPPYVDHGIIGQYDDDTHFWSLHVANNKVYFRAYNDSGGIILYYSWSSVAADTWYHMAVIRGWGGASDKWALCIDGTAVTTATDSTTMPNLTGDLTIGAIAVGGSPIYLDGWMDEVRISKGIARWTENFTPPTSAYGVSAVDLAAGSTSIDLSSLPSSSDSQVTDLEIWRTEGNGSTYYYLTSLTNGTTSYTDNVSDADLGTEELPLDNLKPYSWFDDSLGSYNASMFWITRTQAGEKGRLYYSPVGRSEAVDGYINVTDDSDPLQKLVRYGTGLGVFSTSGFYEILGQNPYTTLEVPGIPGTTAPHTVVETPYGIIYQSHDDIYLLTGRQVTSLSQDRTTPIFLGESASNLSAFSGTVATFARNEYIISDGSQTLAIDPRTRRWRDLGVGCNALAYDESSDTLAASISSKILNFESIGQTDDDGTAITFNVETVHLPLAEDQRAILQGVTVDYKTGDASEDFTFTLIYDTDSTLSLGTGASASRTQLYLPANVACRTAGLRISGSLNYTAEVYDVTFHFYIQPEER